jgi:hypothetical protein
MALLSFVESAPRAYRLKVGNADLFRNSTEPGTSPCVDTNLLIEFVALENIPWKTLAPTVELVRVIVPTKVGEEMDEHKNKTGRLRRKRFDDPLKDLGLTPFGIARA